MACTDEDCAKVEGVICGFLVCLLICSIITCTYFRSKWKAEAIEEEHKEAIKIGVARYVPDKEGAPRFEYITPDSQRRMGKLLELEEKEKHP